MKVFILCFVLFSLAACAPATMQGLRESPTGKMSFEIEENYQAVYRKVLLQGRDCHQASHFFGDQRLVQGDLFNDIKTGNISVVYYSALGIDYCIVVDVVAVADNKSKVNVFYYSLYWGPMARAIEGWVKWGSKECEIPD